MGRESTRRLGEKPHFLLPRGYFIPELDQSVWSSFEARAGESSLEYLIPSIPPGICVLANRRAGFIGSWSADQLHDSNTAWRGQLAFLAHRGCAQSALSPGWNVIALVWNLGTFKKNNSTLKEEWHQVMCYHPSYFFNKGHWATNSYVPMSQTCTLSLWTIHLHLFLKSVSFDIDWILRL